MRIGAEHMLVQESAQEFLLKMPRRIVSQYKKNG
jgi:hypothetical protein